MHKCTLQTSTNTHTPSPANIYFTISTLLYIFIFSLFPLHPCFFFHHSHFFFRSLFQKWRSKNLPGGSSILPSSGFWLLHCSPTTFFFLLSAFVLMTRRTIITPQTLIIQEVYSIYVCVMYNPIYSLMHASM